LPPPRFQLHLVTEPHRGSAELVRAVASALDGGVDWVQLRNKSASAASIYAEAAQLLMATRQRGAQLSVNDRLDVALAVGVDGVHLAGQSLPVGAAVRLAAGRILVGRSVHALDEAVAAAAAGVDYLTFGHVFPTATHPGVPPRGLAELRAIVEAVNVPVLAIGGVSVDNLDEVLRTGCAGIAVISAILADANPHLAAARLRDAMDSSPHQPKIEFRRNVNAADRQPTVV
jgi:thiamine-phosphate pyrophosphorylase